MVDTKETEWATGKKVSVMLGSPTETKNATKEVAKEAKKNLRIAGFKKAETKRTICKPSKMGRSAAWSGGSKTERTEYVHSDGTAMTLSVQMPKYGTHTVITYKSF